MEDGFMKTWQECCSNFNVNPEVGLSTSQVQGNRDKYGPNGTFSLIILKIEGSIAWHFILELPAEEQKPLWQLILEQFDDLLVKILLLAAVISFVSSFDQAFKIRMD